MIVGLSDTITTKFYHTRNSATIYTTQLKHCYCSSTDSLYLKTHPVKQVLFIIKIAQEGVLYLAFGFMPQHTTANITCLSMTLSALLNWVYEIIISRVQINNLLTQMIKEFPPGTFWDL